MRTRTALLTLTLTAGLALAGCGGEEAPAADPSPAASIATATGTEEPEAEETGTEEPETEEPEEPETEGTVVVVTIDGDRIEPNGATVQADLDEPVTLAITSDRAGEMHVHSSPEQYVEFRKGSGEYELTFERPGVVEVEDHETGFVVVQLEVR